MPKIKSVNIIFATLILTGEILSNTIVNNKKMENRDPKKDSIEIEGKEKTNSIYWKVPLAVLVSGGAGFSVWNQNFDENYNTPFILNPETNRMFKFSFQYMAMYINHTGDIENGKYGNLGFKQGALIDFGLYDRLSIGFKNSGMSIGPFIKYLIFRSELVKSAIFFSYGWGPTISSYAVGLANSYNISSKLHFVISPSLGEQEEKIVIYSKVNEEDKDLHYHYPMSEIKIRGLHYQVPIGLTFKMGQSELNFYIAYDEWIETYSMEISQEISRENIGKFEESEKLMVGVGIRYKFWN